MIRESLPKAVLQYISHPPHIFEQVLVLDDLLDGDCSGASDRMPHVRMALRKQAASALDGARNSGVRKHGTDRLIAASETFPDCDEVGCDAFLCIAEQRANAAHSAHDFVRDEENVVPIADFADSSKVTRHRRQASCGCPADDLRYERRNTVRPDPNDRFFKLIRDAQTVVSIRFLVVAAAVSVAGCNELDVIRQIRQIPLPALRVAADGQSAKCDAVITEAATDDDGS